MSEFAFATEGRTFEDVLADILFDMQFKSGPYFGEGYSSEEIREVAMEDIQRAMTIFGIGYAPTAGA